MTRLLLNLIIMGILVLLLNWVFSTFVPSLGNYSLPISILLGVTAGFYIYTLIDNRIG
ncbi:hypothetical protein [Corticicoccus populi]|uniref:Uncharacterized protein n=1 Tax=Corticicoccus populi TaxID=1812821 RepID=A0ABW5WYR6_9STAP